MPSSRDAAQYLRGAACGLAAVCIWSGWIVVARLGLRTSLTPWDIAAIRFGVAGVLLFPLVVSRGLAVNRLGWTGLAAIVLGAQRRSSLRIRGCCLRPLPMPEPASSGAAFAALCPAMTALMAIPILGEWPQKLDWAAIVLISAGVYIVSGGPLPRWLRRTATRKQNPSQVVLREPDR